MYACVCIVIPSEVAVELLFNVTFLSGHFAIQTVKKNFLV